MQKKNLQFLATHSPNTLLIRQWLESTEEEISFKQAADYLNQFLLFPITDLSEENWQALLTHDFLSAQQDYIDLFCKMSEQETDPRLGLYLSLILNETLEKLDQIDTIPRFFSAKTKKINQFINMLNDLTWLLIVKKYAPLLKPESYRAACLSIYKRAQTAPGKTSYIKLGLMLIHVLFIISIVALISALFILLCTISLLMPISAVLFGHATLWRLILLTPSLLEIPLVGYGLNLAINIIHDVIQHFQNLKLGRNLHRNLQLFLKRAFEIKSEVCTDSNGAYPDPHATLQIIKILQDYHLITEENMSCLLVDPNTKDILKILNFLEDNHFLFPEYIPGLLNRALHPTIIEEISDALAKKAGEKSFEIPELDAQTIYILQKNLLLLKSFSATALEPQKNDFISLLGNLIARLILISRATLELQPPCFKDYLSTILQQFKELGGQPEHLQLKNNFKENGYFEEMAKTYEKDFSGWQSALCAYALENTPTKPYLLQQPAAFFTFNVIPTGDFYSPAIGKIK